MILVKRRDIWWIDFDPSIGGEIKKIRPAIVVSNNFANELSNRIQVVPITSNVEKCYPCESYVVVNHKKGKAMSDQIMTVSKQRLKNKIGEISDNEMLNLENAIKLQLDLLQS